MENVTHIYHHQVIPVDYYGSCGTLSCQRNDQEKCHKLLNNYPFVLAFENSFCKDYVTEKFFKVGLPD